MRPTEFPAAQRGDVLVVGSITADLTTFSGRLPARGETILGDEFTMVLGGKGANQAVAASLAGSTTHMVACIGDDYFAALVTQGLTKAGVNLNFVHAVEGPTGIAHIRVDESGENDIVMVPLANSALSKNQIDSFFADPSVTASVLLTQLEIPWIITQHAVRKASHAGLTVILDPAPAVELDADIWPMVDIVTPNETEARILTGISVTDVDTAAQAGRWFVARGARHAIITMSSAGAVLVSGDRVAYFSSIPVEVVDTTAAGDAFAGYLGASLAKGIDLDGAISLAMAAGALTVTKRGASPSLPKRVDVDKLLSALSDAAT
jgi:ribokinase